MSMTKRALEDMLGQAELREDRRVREERRRKYAPAVKAEARLTWGDVWKMVAKK